MNARRRWLPWALGAGLGLALIAPALDPDQQLFFRDTLRFIYPVKQFIAAQLRAGRSPFWEPWTESGSSILAQIAPGLFHPLTLLYLVLPFELAFKLNYLVAVPAAWTGLYLLARRTGSSPWGAAAGACGFAASGYLVSAVASNLQYALGAATMPLALHALLRFAERPRPLRLLWAAYALALCFYGGEPESMLLTGFIGAAWVLGPAVWRRSGIGRAAGLTAAWGACALLLAAPAIGPAVARLRASSRGSGLTDLERSAFANRPARLVGLLLPWAFDDDQEREGTTVYGEYLSRRESRLIQAAFADTMVLGAPLLLLALASGKRGRILVAGGALFVLGSTGKNLGVLPLLEAIVPGLRLFRYAEKLIAPASLLLCLAAASGASRLERKPAGALRLSAACAALLFLFWLGLRLGRDEFALWLRAHGRTGAAGLAQAFAGALERGILFEAAAAAALSAIALWRARRPAFPAAACAAVLCAAAGALQSAGHLYTEPLAAVHAPVPLAEELRAAAGPSEGRWRVRADSADATVVRALDLRASRMMAVAQMLNARFNALAGVESVDGYGSLEDADYENAIRSTPSATNRILGVRFDVQPQPSMTAETAAQTGYRQAAFGLWVKQYPERPRAFLAGCARAFGGRHEALHQLASDRFHLDEAVVREDLRLPCPAPAFQGQASLRRLAADRMLAATDSATPALLIVAEHYDPGWRATVDGRPAGVVQADLTALGIVVPAGKHQVALRFVPDLLWLGLLLCAGCVAGLLGLELLQRQHRVGAAEAE